MKRNTLLTIFLLLITNVFGQTMYDRVEIERIPFKLESGDDIDIEMLRKTSDGYVALKMELVRGPRGWYYILQRLDDNLNAIESKDISELFEFQGYEMKWIVPIENNYMLFSTKLFKDEKLEKLFYQKLDPSTLTLSNPVFIHAEIRQPDEFKTIEFSTDVSPDNSLILLSIIPTNQELDKGLIAQYYLFDQEVNKFEKYLEYDLENDGQQRFISSPGITNDGQIYFLQKTTTNREITEGVKHDLDLVMLDGFKKNFSLKSDDNVPLGASTSLLKDKLLVVSNNLCQEPETILNYTCFELDPNTLAINNQYTIEIEREILIGDISPRKVAEVDLEKRQSAYEVYYGGIVDHEDGSFTIISEYLNDYDIFYTGWQGYRGGFIFTRVFPNGKVVNTLLLKKNLHKNALRIFSLNSELAVLWEIERAELLDIDLSTLKKKERRAIKGGMLAVTQISADGEIYTSGILDRKSDPYKRYKPYEELGKDSFIFTENGELEIVVKSDLGDYQFSLVRLKFN